MKLNDYKETLAALHTPAGLRERVLKNCMNGEEPKEFEDGHRTFDKVKRVLSVAATFAVIVVVAVAMVMLTRFIGPETPQGPGGEPGFSETKVEGFRLISVESTLDGLSAQIDSFDTASKTLAMSWVNNSGKELTLGRQYSLTKYEGETWSTNSFEKLNTIFWEEDLREFPSGTECSDYGVVGSLAKWSDNLTAGIYKVEKEFWGDGGPYTVTIIFELTSDKVIRDFKLISVESTLDGLTAIINSYDISTKSLDVTWVNNSGKELLFGQNYVIKKFIDGSWSGECFEKTVYFNTDARILKTGEECSDYGSIGSLTKWSDNITAGTYKVEKAFGEYIVTITFELLEEEENEKKDEKTHFDSYEIISEQTALDDNLRLVFKDIDVQNQTIIIYYVNYSGAEMTYTGLPWVEKLIDGTWHRVEWKKSSDEIVSVAKQKRVEITPMADWSLESVCGTYRIEHSVTINETIYNLSTSFELKKISEDTNDTTPSDTNDTGDNNVPDDGNESKPRVAIMISNFGASAKRGDYRLFAQLLEYSNNEFKIGFLPHTTNLLMYYGEYSVKYEDGEFMEPLIPLEKFEEGILLKSDEEIKFDLHNWFPNEIEPGEYRLKLKCISAVDGSEQIVTVTFTANEVLQDNLFYVKSSFGDYYEVAGIGAVTSNEIEIRSTYKGLPVKKIQPNAFENCTNITKIKMPDTIERIEMYAFRGCTNLESVEFSKEVWMIEDYAFQGCSSLKNIVLPNSVKSIGDGVFSCCENIESLIVEEGSENYFSKGNCIFYTIDNKTTLIAGCKNSHVSFEDNITHIGTSAFEGITVLTSLNLPKTLVDVGASAFRDCHNLQITYNGTVEEWYSIRRVGAEENGDPKITVICTDGTARCYGRDDA